jgi:hypothetical protein
MQQLKARSGPERALGSDRVTKYGIGRRPPALETIVNS